MKKLFSCCLMAIVLGSTTISVEGAESNLDFVTVLTLPEKKDATILTLEEATQRALSRSTSLKTTNMDLKISEEKLEEEESNIANGRSFDQLVSYLKQNTSYSNAKLSKQVEEESVAHSLKQVYIEIINQEREIVLAKAGLKSAEQELLIARTKEKLGLLSEADLQTQELQYQKEVDAVEKQEDNVKEAYNSLGSLIGMEVDESYQLDIEPVYEPLTMEMSLSTYITGKVNTDPNIQQQKNTLDTTETEAKFTKATATETIEEKEADNSIAKEELTLADQKESLREKIENCYHSILQLETSYETNLQELESLKQQLTITEKQYELEQTTALAVEQAKQSVMEKESELIGQVYEHMLLLEEFENSYLL